MEGRHGEQTHKVKLYDAEARREIDNEVTDHTIDFMQRSVKAGKPFFAYVPFTQPHMPTEASRAFTGKTGNGPFADMLAEMDFNSGTDSRHRIEARDRERYNRYLQQRQWPRGNDSLARLGGPMDGDLCNGNGRLASRPLHHPLAG